MYEWQNIYTKPSKNKKSFENAIILRNKVAWVIVYVGLRIYRFYKQNKEASDSFKSNFVFAKANVVK